MLKPETIALQSQLATYCRTGREVENIAAPAERLKHYRRLVYNVTYGILAQAYPITYNLLSNESWKTMVDNFVANHPCIDPQVWKMPGELIDFVSKIGYKTFDAPEFLVDLLKFEWLEVEVYSMSDIEIPTFMAIDNWLTDSLCFNPHYQILELQYPVHQLNKLKPEAHKDQYFILSFRDEVGKVRFISIQAIQAVLLDTLIQNPGFSAQDIFDSMADETDFTVTKNTEEKLIELLSMLHTKGFLLGKLVD